VNGGTCTAACVDQGRRQTACVDGDGCCPAGCSDFNDTDCPTKNDLCGAATDISAGGDFPFSLMTARQESPLPMGCNNVNAGPEVFFMFRLAAPSAIYLDVYDPAGNPVNVQLEVYLGQCPTGQSPFACDDSSGRACPGTGVWPRIFNTNTDNTTYFVAARANNGKRGRYTLRFHSVPLACIGGYQNGGNLTSFSVNPDVGTTCGGTDKFAATCDPSGLSGEDRGYYYMKCPNQGFTVSTCQGRTIIDTVVQAYRGSMQLANGKCTPTTGKVVACTDDDGASCSRTTSSTLSNLDHNPERGIYTIDVDTYGRATCGGYGVGFTLNP
jgi:hypothetical protein